MKKRAKRRPTTNKYAKRYQPQQITKVRNDGIVLGALVSLVFFILLSLFAQL